MKYEKGNVIKVKTAEEIELEYGSFDKVPFGLNMHMRGLFGATVTIRKSYPMADSNKGRSGYTIHIDEDEGKWTWHGDMFWYEENVTDKVINVLRGL